MNAGVKYVYDMVVGDYLTVLYESGQEGEITRGEYLLFCKGLVYLMKAEQGCSFNEAYYLVSEFDVDGLLPPLEELA